MFSRKAPEQAVPARNQIPVIEPPKMIRYLDPVGKLYYDLKNLQRGPVKEDELKQAERKAFYEGFSAGEYIESTYRKSDVIIDRDLLKQIVNERVNFLDECQTLKAKLEGVSSQLTGAKDEIVKYKEYCDGTEEKLVKLTEQNHTLNRQLQEQGDEIEVGDRLISQGETTKDNFRRFVKLHSEMMKLLSYDPYDDENYKSGDYKDE